MPASNLPQTGSSLNTSVSLLASSVTVFTAPCTSGLVNVLSIPCLHFLREFAWHLMLIFIMIAVTYFPLPQPL